MRVRRHSGKRDKSRCQMAVEGEAEAEPDALDEQAYEDEDEPIPNLRHAYAGYRTNAAPVEYAGDEAKRLQGALKKEIGGTFLDITTMLSYRPDGHIEADCGHWCLLLWLKHLQNPRLSASLYCRFVASKALP